MIGVRLKSESHNHAIDSSSHITDSLVSMRMRDAMRANMERNEDLFIAQRLR